MSATDRIYWLGFAMMLRQRLFLSATAAAVLAQLVRAGGKSIRGDGFEAIGSFEAKTLTFGSAKTAVAWARDALLDAGLQAKIITERGARGEGLSRYRLEGAGCLKAFVEGGA